MRLSLPPAAAGRRPPTAAATCAASTSLRTARTSRGSNERRAVRGLDEPRASTGRHGSARLSWGLEPGSFRSVPFRSLAPCRLGSVRRADGSLRERHGISSLGAKASSGCRSGPLRHLLLGSQGIAASPSEIRISGFAIPFAASAAALYKLPVNVTQRQQPITPPTGERLPVEQRDE